MSKVKVSSTDAEGSVELNALIPTIKNGWWTDNKGTSISQALLTDIVTFHIETENISDQSEVCVTIMDDDGAFNADDQILQSKIIIENNHGYVNMELRYEWLKYIDEDAGDCIELFIKCEFQNTETNVPCSKNKYLKVYNIGYINHNDSRVRVNKYGSIEFWPENMTAIAHKSWEGLSEDSANWSPQSIGITREIGYISFTQSSAETIPFNSDDKDPNANDARLATERGKKKDGTEDLRQTQRYIVTASSSTRIKGAGVILIVNIVLTIIDYGMQYLQIHENNTLQRHLKIFAEAFNNVSAWYKMSVIPAQYNNYTSFYEIINIVLFGGMYYSNDKGLLLLAKEIYKKNTLTYEKD